MTQKEIITVLVLGVVGGVLANDVGDWSSWLARRMMRRAAHLWTSDATITEVYAEEWQAVVNERPGNMLKLLTGLGYLSASLARRGSRKASRVAARRKRPQVATWATLALLGVIEAGFTLRGTIAPLHEVVLTVRKADIAYLFSLSLRLLGVL
ncbi:MAG TPA: hypothetical protein VFM54_19470 [Micromonosporaceae bacterium]|nr:hypothetical protein [Micromonosporaceae bacterium]